MEKSRKKSNFSKVYYIVLICVIVFVVSVVAGRMLFSNKVQVKQNGENQIKNVVDNEKKESVQVPKLVGEDFEEAKEKLENVNLRVEKIEEKSSTLESGIVFKQEPTYNTTVEEGTTIKLYVSIGE